MTTSFFTDIGELAYKELKLKLVTNAEGNSPSVYLDPDGIPTVGIGWNILVPANLRTFLVDPNGLGLEEPEQTDPIECY